MKQVFSAHDGSTGTACARNWMLMFC